MTTSEYTDQSDNTDGDNDNNSECDERWLRESPTIVIPLVYRIALHGADFRERGMHRRIAALVLLVAFFLISHLFNYIKTTPV